MTTARVKYRDNVPYGWIAIKFCHVNFFGNEAEKLGFKWDEIQYKKYNQVNPKIESLDKTIQQSREEIDEIEHDLFCIIRKKKWWKRMSDFWKGPAERELEQKREALNRSIKEAESKKKVFEKNLFYETRELIRMAEAFLNENGFVLQSSTCTGSECVTHIDLWTKE